MSSSPLLNRSTTRKRPHCKDCGQPLKGHPKGICMVAPPSDYERAPTTVSSRGSASASPGPSLPRVSPDVDTINALAAPQIASFATPRLPRAPDLRPVMPCTFDRNDRPSEVSASPSVRGPTGVSLFDRIGPKVEVDENDNPLRPAGDPTPRSRSRNGFSSRHSDPIAPRPLSFYDHEQPRAVPLRHAGSSIFPDHSASQRPADWRTPTPSPWLGDRDRDEVGSQDSFSETSSYINGYNGGRHYNLDVDDNDRYFYDNDVHRISQRAVVGRSSRVESSPESQGFPDDTPSETSASEAGTMLSAAPTDRTGLSINTLLQAGDARPLMSLYAVKRELGSHLKQSARKLGLHAGVKRPPSNVRGTAEDVILAMGRDRHAIQEFMNDPHAPAHAHALASGHSPVHERDLHWRREREHQRDGHRRTSTHACELCHSATPTAHHPALYPHTPVGPHHPSLPPPPSGSAAAVAPHMYTPQYGAAMAPPLPPPSVGAGAMGVVGTVCTVIVALFSMGGAVLYVLGR